MAFVSDPRKWFASNSSAKSRSAKTSSHESLRRRLQIDPLEERRLLALTYTLTPLGDLAGGSFASFATSLNNAGEIVGLGTSGSNQQATSFDSLGGSPTGLGALPGDVHSLATDINGFGNLTGRSGPSTGLPSTTGAPGVTGDRGFLYDAETETWIDIGDLPGGQNWSAGLSINDANQIVGGSGTGGSGDYHAFIWGEENRNEQQTVSFLGGPPTSGSFVLRFRGEDTDPIAFNASAATVESALEALPDIGVGNVSVATDPDPNIQWRVTFQGTLANTNVPPLAAPSSSSTLDNGAVASIATTVQGSHAGLIDLGDLSGGSNQSVAHGINSLGQVAGWGSSEFLFQGFKQAFFWDPIDNVMVPLAPSPPLLSLSPFDSFAYDINNIGLVAGVKETPEVSELNIPAGFIAGVWDTNADPASNGNYSFIPILPIRESGDQSTDSVALAINDFLTTVGRAELPNSSVDHAWVMIGTHSFTDPNTGEPQDESELPIAFDLNDLVDSSGAGWVLNSATDVNEAGQIIGYGKNPLNQTEAFLLTPVNTAPQILDPIENKITMPGQTVTWTVTISDADNAIDPEYDRITFTLDEAALDAGMTINRLNNTTAEVSWTPTLSSPSELSFTVTARDDGYLLKSDTRTGHVGVKKPVLFTEDFEGGSLGEHWQINTSGLSQATLTTSQSATGSQSLLLDASTSSLGKHLVEAILTVDLSGVTDTAILTFQQLEGTLGSITIGELFDAFPGLGAHSLGTNGDGLSISVNGTDWYPLLDVTGKQFLEDREADGLWQLYEFDLGAEIERINDAFGAGLSFTSSVQLKFTQYDNNSFPDRGFAIDTLRIDNGARFAEASLATDIFHRLNTGDGEELYRVGFFGNVNASTPIVVSMHGAEREVGIHTTYWQQYVANPANGVDSLIVVAPFYRQGGKYEGYGRLAWNASDDRALDESLLEFLDSLTTTTGLGDDSELYLFGFSRGAHFVEAFAAARPDRVAAVVAAGADRQTFPIADVGFPYDVLESTAFPSPPEVTLDQQEYLSQRMMIWIGQNDVVDVTDQGPIANAQGLLRTDRAANMFRTLHEEAGDLALAYDDYEYEFYIQEDRGHLVLPSDIATFYEFLFRDEQTPPLDEPLLVEPVIVTSPTTTERSATLPSGVTQLPDLNDFYVEIWVTTPHGAGITSGSFELVFDDSLVEVVGIDHGSVFTDATTGTFSNPDSRVYNVGGTTTQTDVGVGEYALLARVHFTALAGIEEIESVLLALQRGQTEFELDGGDNPRTDLLPFEAIELVTVNDPPVFDPFDDQTIGEGPWSLIVSATDLDPGDSLSFSLGSGAPVGMTIVPGPGAREATIEWTPGDDQLVSPNPFTVEVIVMDNGVPVESDAATFQITVENTAPTVNISGSVAGKAGDSLPFNFDAVDPAPEDQAGSFTYQIDWNNDGTFDQTINDDDSTSTTHTFATAGSFTIGVRAVDKDGGVGEVSKHVVHIFSLTTDGGNIVWNGSGGNDRVEFVQTSATEVTVNTVMVGGHTINASELLPVTGQVQAFGHNGNDRLDATQLTDTPVYFEGGFGNDTLVGSDMNDVLKGDFDGAAGDGAEGNDRIEGRGGNDSIFGDGAEGGADTIFGGEGDDIIRGDGGDGAEGRSDRLIGGGGNDQIFGHTGNDFIDGGGDNDLLVGGRDGSEGDDTIIGGSGNDILVGEKGNDRLEGTSGFNILLGGVGSDTLVAGTGADILVADQTDYDQSPAGLAALRAEWASGGAYATRIDNIRTGGGLTGGNTLDAGTSVIDDGAVDHLFGNNQIELNWYIYNLAFDQITGKHATEEADDTDGT